MGNLSKSFLLLSVLSLTSWSEQHENTKLAESEEALIEYEPLELDSLVLDTGREKQERANEFVYRLGKILSCVHDENFDMQRSLWHLSSVLALTESNDETLSQSGVALKAFQKISNYCGSSVSKAMSHEQCLKTVWPQFQKMFSYFFPNEKQKGEGMHVLSWPRQNMTMVEHINREYSNEKSMGNFRISQFIDSVRGMDNNLSCNYSTEAATAVNEKNSAFSGEATGEYAHYEGNFYDSLKLDKEALEDLGVRLSDFSSDEISRVLALPHWKVKRILESAKRGIGINIAFESLASFEKNRFPDRWHSDVRKRVRDGYGLTYVKEDYIGMLAPMKDEDKGEAVRFAVYDMRTGEVEVNMYTASFGKNTSGLSNRSGSGSTPPGPHLTAGLYNGARFHNNYKNKYVYRSHGKEGFDFLKKHLDDPNLTTTEFASFYDDALTLVSLDDINSPNKTAEGRGVVIHASSYNCLDGDHSLGCPVVPVVDRDETFEKLAGYARPPSPDATSGTSLGKNKYLAKDLRPGEGRRFIYISAKKD